METKIFKPFFSGYLPAACVSLGSMYLLFLISARFLNWYFFEFVFSCFLGTLLHLVFLTPLYFLIFPMLSYFDKKEAQSSFRVLMERYIPYFAIPFGFLLGLVWFGGGLDKLLTFILLDMLFTCYIGLYFYVKNKCKQNETAL